MVIEVTRVLQERHFRAGYVVRKEYWNSGTDAETLMSSAYNLQGDYIGRSREAHRLWTRYGVKPEKADPTHSVCSIGFSERDQKWYGWSHRAIYGFGIGSSVKMGDCGFEPSSREELVERCTLFWNDGSTGEHTITETDYGLRVTSYRGVSVPGDGRLGGLEMISHHYEPWPEHWGRGAWTAATLEEARVMAVAFANDVS